MEGIRIGDTIKATVRRPTPQRVQQQPPPPQVYVPNPLSETRARVYDRSGREVGDHVRDWAKGYYGRLDQLTTNVINRLSVRDTLSALKIIHPRHIRSFTWKRYPLIWNRPPVYAFGYHFKPDIIVVKDRIEIDVRRVPLPQMKVEMWDETLNFLDEIDYHWTKWHKETGIQEIIIKGASYSIIVDLQHEKIQKLKYDPCLEYANALQKFSKTSRPFRGSAKVPHGERKAKAIRTYYYLKNLRRLCSGQ